MNRRGGSDGGTQLASRAGAIAGKAAGASDRSAAFDSPERRGPGGTGVAGGVGGGGGPSPSDRAAVDRIIARFASEVGAQSFDRHFRDQARLRLESGFLHVTVPTGFVADLLGRKYGEALRRAADAETVPDAAGGRGPLSIRFRVDRRAFARDGETAAPGAPQHKTVRPRAHAELAPKSRLEDFVVGQSNRLAYEAAVRIASAERPGAFGMLFVHGPCGVGKTHLLQGVARRFRETSPGAKIRYTTAEAFTNEYIAAVRAGTLEAFRKAYRRVELLCVDDVHFFSSKQATQAELLHTFDAIGSGGSRIVLASDAAPRQIARMSEALVSRFMSGMVVRLDPPELPLREEIVRRLAAARDLPLEPGAPAMIAAMASGPGGSVRDLEGAVTRVDAVWRMTGAEGAIGAMVVRRAMGMGGPGEEAFGGPIRRARRPVTAGRIASDVCRALAVDHADFVGRGRHKRVVLARSLAAYLCRSMTTMSFPEIARAMGRPNHSTIVTAVKRLGRQIELDQPLDAQLVAGAPDLATPGDSRPVTVRLLAERLGQDIARTAAQEPGR